MKRAIILPVVGAAFSAVLAPGPASQAQTSPATGSAAGGTAGSAAAGSTSASSLGLGGTSTDESGTSSVLGVGSSAAAADGRAQSRSHVVDNPNRLIGQSRGQAMDKGTFSRSHTRTTVEKGGEVVSTTRSMSHVPGQKPEITTTTTRSGDPQ